MSDEEKGFVIKDRRIFSEEDQDSKETETKEDKAESPEKPDGEDLENAQQQADAEAEEADAGAPLPEVNFPTFVISLNASALVNLGVIEDPATGKKVKNLPMAKQTIDILSMLEKKTRGNLSGDEENILKNVLYDLRILYVKEKK